ncbi:MAG: bifunctional 4-hydroxy-2-oxoglutarate aldolase/2-dehydro-3-deoxy-phosphogluconate aldolase [Saprospiraceae bacterium]
MKSDMNLMMPYDIATKIDDAGIIAVLVIDELKHALPLAEALLKGGVDTVELTLRTPIAFDAAIAIKKEFPEIVLGFGTLITIDQISKVVDAGADFAVAPGCNPRIIVEAKNQGLPFAPGIMTPSDIELAIELGCQILKYFPAETSGGLKNLESMVAPYQYLGLKFIPLGGLSLENSANYLKSPLITAIGGSWLAKSQLIKDEQWNTITKNALEIKNLIKEIKH